MQITPKMCSDHGGIKLNINKENRSGKYPNVCKLRNVLLSNPQVREEVTMKIRAEK